IGITCTPAKLDPHIAAVDPAQLLHRFQERHDVGLRIRVVRGPVHQRADAQHPVGLLRSRRERPRSRAADKRDKVAPLHSITSSARAMSVGGISRPSALAVWRLMVKLNLVERSIGRSAALAPLSILSTKAAAR